MHPISFRPDWLVRFCAGVAGCILLPGAALAVTFTVTNTASSGPGSLSQAILDANATSGPDAIEFAIPGAGPHTISLLAALPPVSDQTSIDATTQPGYATHPVIELNGAAAGVTAIGIRVTAAGCTIRGLAINRFAIDGIRLENPGNVVQGCFIGTDVLGTTALNNGQSGIFVLGSPGNTIGGTNPNERNVIAANATGIYLLDGGASNNLIVGNFIGTTSAGTSRLGNTNNGIAIYNAPGNVIGGASPAARNVISGNGGSGVNVNISGAVGNRIEGNYIGTDVSGAYAISNVADGITINGAISNVIGGTVSGAGNLISGNGHAGIFVNGPGAAGNLMSGNLIGTDASGMLAIGNTYAGITLSGASTNQIGGDAAAAMNVVSGNRQDGIFLIAGSTANTIQGNHLGVAVNGTNRLGNGFNGVAISGSAGNLIGGVAPGTKNIIAGNTNNGVWITNATAGANSVQGNIIGTDLSGRLAVPNAFAGVRLESPGNLVGGPGAGNLISGNAGQGVWINGSGANGNVVQGNLIGVASGGTNVLANGKAGVGVTDGSSNLIGGVIASTGNVISGNAEDGMFIIGAAAKANQLSGNLIGTDITGNSALPNQITGLYIEGAASNVVGGAAAGMGNVISGNRFDGLWLKNTAGNVLQGNFIGTKADGTNNLGNGNHALEMDAGALGNLVGGPVSGAANVIAYSQGQYTGVRVRDGATGNAILRNSIFGNGALGIDLGLFGASANDNCDGDGGGNMLQNFPVLLQAYSSVNTGVRGFLNSQPNKAYVVQFFANPSCDSSGYGEGGEFLGELSLVTSAGCTGSFTATLGSPVPVGRVITATATDEANNTSEFSACLAVMPVPLLNLAPAGSGQVTLAWTNTATGFVLKETGSLTPPVVWETVTNVPVPAGGQLAVTLSSPTGNRFFRLTLE